MGGGGGWWWWVGEGWGRGVCVVVVVVPERLETHRVLVSLVIEDPRHDRHPNCDHPEQLEPLHGQQHQNQCLWFVVFAGCGGGGGGGCL